MEIIFDPPLKLYIVTNQEGKYFKSIGYGGSGSNWVSDINKAKVYLKIGMARSRVTFFASNYPTYGIPDILEITAGNAVKLDETKRVKKAIDKKATAKADAERRQAKWVLEDAQRKFNEAQQRLNALKK